MAALQHGWRKTGSAPLTRSVMWSSLWGLFLLVAGVAGCVSPFTPEPGFPAPVDPGSIVVRVRDEASAAISNVHVSVELPNAGGGVFYVGHATGADGKAEFTGVPAGRRRVQIIPPEAFTSDDLIRDVDVIKDRTTQVEYVLIRR